MSTDQRAGNHPSGDQGAGAPPAHPIDFTPSWYLEALKKREQDSDFGNGGAVGALTTLWPAILTAWVLIAAMAAFFWLVTP